MNRAVSTAVDVVVFLALVSAAVLAFATIPGSPAAEPPDATPLAMTLSGATATVEYEVPGARPTVRRAHGTLAGLLATATVERARAAGTNVSPAGAPFGRAVARAVRDGLGPAGGGWQVIVRWNPYPGSRLEGSMSVGNDPPPDATVAADRLTVPTGIVLTRDPVAVAEQQGYPGLATVVGNALHRRFGTGAGAGAVNEDGLGSETLTADRARRLRSIFAIGDDPGGMTATIERRLRDATTDPVAAAEALAIDEVTVVVRRWST